MASIAPVLPSGYPRDSEGAIGDGGLAQPDPAVGVA
jgi:hypothetical protein